MSLSGPRMQKKTFDSKLIFSEILFSFFCYYYLEDALRLQFLKL